MGEWLRSTKECVYESLPKPVIAEIQKHLETYNLGSIIVDYSICIESTAVKKKKGLFSGSGNKTLNTFVILTPSWMVWVTSGDKSGIGVLSAQIKDINFVDFKDSPAFQILQDTGIHVTGIFTGRIGMHGNQQISNFIGLGEETAADRFKQKLAQAIQETRRK